MGISAVIIGDKYKIKIGLTNKEVLYDEKEFSYKIKEGKKALRNPDFMIIAGIEELNFGKSIEDALEKVFSSIKAGVDGILISSNKNIIIQRKIFEWKKKWKRKRI